MRLTVSLLLLAALLLSLPPTASAQGCAMCRTAAAAANEAGQKTLDLAILVLLIPTVSIFLAVFYWAYRRRNQTREDLEAKSLPLSFPTELREATFSRSSRWWRGASL